MPKELDKKRPNPPRPGMIWNPQTHRWMSARPSSGQQPSQINPEFLGRMGNKELEKMQSDVRARMTKERDSSRFNDLCRINRILTRTLKFRAVNKALVSARRLHKRMVAQQVAEGATVILKGLTVESAIPVEQLKGDIARAGHVVKSIIAIDPEMHRVFFMSTDNEHRYAEFAGPDGAWALQKMGYQADIAKEYDPVDLEADGDIGDNNMGEMVISGHEEREDDETPGMLPSGTPGEKPAVDEHGENEVGYEGSGIGDEGFGNASRHVDRRDTIKSLTSKLDVMLR